VTLGKLKKMSFFFFVKKMNKNKMEGRGYRGEELC
jgi:hypothetical protein